MTAAITAADIAAAGTFNVTVTNPAPGGGTSANSPFTVNNPVPTITSLSPASAVKGGAAFTLTVNGTNFVSTSVVNFNGSCQDHDVCERDAVDGSDHGGGYRGGGNPSMSP